MTAQPKKAILLIGHLRTWEYCKKSFVASFSNEPCDIFLSTYDKQYGYHPYIQQTLKFFDDHYLTERDIESSFKGLNLVEYLVESQDMVDGVVIEQAKGWDSNMTEFTHGYSQYRKVEQCLEMMRRHEQKHGFKYDVVIKTRPDLIYTGKPLPEIEQGMLLSHSGGVQPNDWLLIGPRDVVDRIPKLVFAEYQNPKVGSNKNPPHGLLANVVACLGYGFQVDDLVKLVRRNNESLILDG